MKVRVQEIQWQLCNPDREPPEIGYYVLQEHGPDEMPDYWVYFLPTVDPEDIRQRVGELLHHEVEEINPLVMTQGLQNLNDFVAAEVDPDEENKSLNDLVREALDSAFTECWIRFTFEGELERWELNPLRNRTNPTTVEANTCWLHQFERMVVRENGQNVWVGWMPEVGIVVLTEN